MAKIIGYIPASTNLVPNPSGEVDTQGWVFARNGTGTVVGSVSNVWSWVGQKSLKIEVTVGSPTAIYMFPNNTFASSFRIPVTPGLPYSMKARVIHFNGGNRRFAPAYIFYNSSNTNIATANLTVINPAVPGTMYTSGINGIIAPANATHMVFYFPFAHTDAVSPMAIGEHYYLDGLHIEQTEEIGSYVDGAQGTNYYWTGTAHLSTSGKNATPIYGAAGHRGHITIEPKLFKADKYNNIADDVSDCIISGSVEMRTDREIKMQFKGTLLHPSGINPLTDYVAPFMRLKYPDGTEVFEQIGLYSFASPGETWNESYALADFQSYDLTWNLQQSSFGVPYTVAAGTNVVASMRTILNNQGFTRWAIPDDSATFATARTWETDDSILRILNDHAESIGYYTLHCDRVGIIESFPYYDLDNAEPAATYFSGPGSQVVGAIKRERLSEGIFNMVRVLDENAAGTPITWTQTNSNATSPVSTTSLNRTIFREIKVRNLASLAVAKQIARRALRDAASVYTRYQLTTLPDPSRNVWEIYDTAIYQKGGAEVINGKVRCSGWDIGFTPQTAVMTHYVNRLEPYE